MVKARLETRIARIKVDWSRSTLMQRITRNVNRRFVGQICVHQGHFRHVSGWWHTQRAAWLLSPVHRQTPTPTSWSTMYTPHKKLSHRVQTSTKSVQNYIHNWLKCTLLKPNFYFQGLCVQKAKKSAEMPNRNLQGQTPSTQGQIATLIEPFKPSVTDE